MQYYIIQDALLKDAVINSGVDVIQDDSTSVIVSEEQLVNIGVVVSGANYTMDYDFARNLPVIVTVNQEVIDTVNRFRRETPNEENETVFGNVVLENVAAGFFSADSGKILSDSASKLKAKRVLVHQSTGITKITDGFLQNIAAKKRDEYAAIFILNANYVAKENEEQLFRNITETEKIISYVDKTNIYPIVWKNKAVGHKYISGVISSVFVIYDKVISLIGEAELAVLIAESYTSSKTISNTTIDVLKTQYNHMTDQDVFERMVARATERITNSHGDVASSISNVAKDIQKAERNLEDLYSVYKALEAKMNTMDILVSRSKNILINDVKAMRELSIVESMSMNHSCMFVHLKSGKIVTFAFNEVAPPITVKSEKSNDYKKIEEFVNDLRVIESIYTEYYQFNLCNIIKIINRL